MKPRGELARLSLVDLVVRKRENLCLTKIDRNDEEATVSPTR